MVSFPIQIEIDEIQNTNKNGNKNKARRCGEISDDDAKWIK